ncbi:DUF4252 domain-containing protein [Chryseotalea sanaruensis]|jgi:hypothetical protein|uniref:DUF4252 domain-containing protein n=1 Tax=Chryseotalea sanaruensis TaxID=2482724 RepID=A0A401UBX9_9BACT|nr:DUF4252 domain-containing protein [Chryseotalea sanaruensis]GCC52374.1 DUF4252 domain-containing protein [Chryseotalea sanaruensis]
MKKLMLALVMMAGYGITFGQTDAISKFFAKYQNDESFSNVTVSSKMFSLFTNMDVETAEDKEVVEAISKIKGLRILAKEDARNARDLYKEAFTLIPMKDYEELMTVRDKDQDMKFLIKDDGKGKISELIMIMGGTTDFMIMTLYGEIDLKQVSRIGKRMEIDGLDKLENLDKKKN